MSSSIAPTRPPGGFLDDGAARETQEDSSPLKLTWQSESAGEDKAAAVHEGTVPGEESSGERSEDLPRVSFSLNWVLNLPARIMSGNHQRNATPKTALNDSPPPNGHTGVYCPPIKCGLILTENTAEGDRMSLLRWVLKIVALSPWVYSVALSLSRGSKLPCQKK